MRKTMTTTALAGLVIFTPTPTYAAALRLDLSSGQIARVYDGCRSYGVGGRFGPIGSDGPSSDIAERTFHPACHIP